MHKYYYSYTTFVNINIQHSNKTAVISIDRLKPAFIVNKGDEPTNTTSAERQQCANAAADDSKMHEVTRSGQTIKPVV